MLPSSARLNSVRILSHYFVARFLGLFATVLIAALVVLATVELVLGLDEFAAFDSQSNDSEVGSPFAAFRFLSIRLASFYLPDLLPLASFIAVFITFAWAGRSMELVAIQAGGVRLRRIVGPVLVTALILSCATAVLHETLILRARQIWSSETKTSDDQPEFGRTAFWYHKGRTITNIASANPETRTMYGVEIFERSAAGTVVRVMRADRVQIAPDGVWHLEDARIWTFDPNQPIARPILEQSQSIALDLDAIGGDALLAADPGILPLPALARYLEAHPQETPSNLRRLANLYHERLSSPWLVLVFAWLALPFALRVDRSGHFAGPAATGFATLGVIFLVQSAGNTISRQALLPVGLIPWLAILVIVVGTAFALRREPL